MAETLFSKSYRDYSKEVTRVQLRIAYPADAIARDVTVGALNTALDGVVNAQEITRNVTYTEKLGNGFSIDPTSRRETKLLVRYEDSVNFKLYTTEIPAVDTSVLTYVANTDFVDITAGTAIPALVTALETYVVSPDDNAITVLDMQVVGRNL